MRTIKIKCTKCSNDSETISGMTIVELVTRTLKISGDKPDGKAVTSKALIAICNACKYEYRMRRGKTSLEMLDPAHETNKPGGLLPATIFAATKGVPYKTVYDAAHSGRLRRPNGDSGYKYKNASPNNPGYALLYVYNDASIYKPVKRAKIK